MSRGNSAPRFLLLELLLIGVLVGSGVYFVHRVYGPQALLIQTALLLLISLLVGLIQFLFSLYRR